MRAETAVAHGDRGLPVEDRGRELVRDALDLERYGSVPLRGVVMAEHHDPVELQQPVHRSLDEHGLVETDRFHPDL